MVKAAKPSYVYSYKGSVMRYGREVLRNWSAQTTAKSEKQAINNLLFQARLLLKLEAKTKLELSDKPKQIASVSKTAGYTRYHE